jgi:hypothetical protein
MIVGGCTIVDVYVARQSREAQDAMMVVFCMPVQLTGNLLPMVFLPLFVVQFAAQVDRLLFLRCQDYQHHA